MSDTEYQQHTIPFDNREHYAIHPWGTSDISTDWIGYIQYKAGPKQVEAGVVVGEILLTTLHFVECMFEMEVLKLTAHRCTCIWLDHVSCQLTGGAWLEFPARTSYAHKWECRMDGSAYQLTQWTVPTSRPIYPSCICVDSPICDVTMG